MAVNAPPLAGYGPPPSLLASLPGSSQPMVGDGYDSTLGRAISQWRSGLGRPIGLTILWLFMPGMFVFLGLTMRHGGGTLAAVCGTLTVLLIAATWFFLSGGLVTIYTDGIERRGRTGVKRLPWAQLQSYRVIIMDNARVGGTAAAGRAGGLIGILIAVVVMAIIRNVRKTSGKPDKPSAIALLGHDGTKLQVSGSLKGFADLAGALIPFLTERLGPVAMREYESGQRVGFGKKLSIQKNVGITFIGAFGGANVLPFIEIETVIVHGAWLTIRKKGKTLAWQRLQVSAIPNVHVFENIIASEKIGHVFS